MGLVKPSVPLYYRYLNIHDGYRHLTIVDYYIDHEYQLNIDQFLLMLLMV